MTQVVFSAIKIKGVFNLYDLEDLDEEDLGNMFTNMRRPPPRLTAGVSVLVQGINVSANYQKRLIIASIAARHYKLVGRDLNPSMMKWKVLMDFYLQLTVLGDNKNQDDPDVPVMKKRITTL